MADTPESGGKCLRTSCHQLVLLLWRNILIRWRGGSVSVFKKVSIPVFHLLEVVWPLALYVILVILRKKFPPENVDDSKYRAFALPSAGTLPFLQSLFCDFGTGKDEGPYSDMPAFPNATLNQLYTVLDEVGTWNASWTQVCDSIHNLAGQVDCLQSNATLVSVGCYTVNPDSVPLTCYLKNSTEFYQYLSNNLSLSQRVVDGIIGSTVNTSQLSTLTSLFLPSNSRAKRQADTGRSFDILPLLQSFNFDPNLVRPIVCTSNQLAEIVHFANISAMKVREELCNLSDSQWLSLSQELQQQITTGCSTVEVVNTVSQVLALQQLLEQNDVIQLFEGFSEVDGTGGEQAQEQNSGCEHSLDDYIHHFCGSIRKKPSSALRSILSRSCYGDSYKQANSERTERENKTSSSTNVKQNSLKILYTPYTNLTFSVIQKANRTFNSAGLIIAFADQVANCSEFFLENFPPESFGPVLSVLSQVIEYKESGGKSGPGTVDITPLFPNVSLETLLEAQQLLNASAPNNIWSLLTAVHNVSVSISDALGQFDWDVFLSVADEKELEELAGDYQRQNDMGITYVIAGIVFDRDLSSDMKGTTITIRTNFSSVVDTSEYKENIWYPGPEDNFWKSRYIDGFFIFVQDMIERAVLEEIVGDRVASPGVYLQEMPYPCYKEDRFTISLLYVLPLAMLFAWLFPVAMTTRAVVREKETRLKEFMKIMGVGEGLLRLSWFLHSMVVLLLSVVGITVLLKYGGLLPATDAIVLFLYLTLYAVVMLSYSFLMSSFFNNANLAACVAALVYFIVFFAHVTIVPNLNSLSPVLIGVFCLWAPLAFGLGCTFLVQWELKQQGLMWSNLTIPAIEDDHLSFLAIVFIMGLDAVLYFLITWYIEGVFPGRYGVAKPWYFPALPSYWCGQSYTCIKGCNKRSRHVTLNTDEEEMIRLSELNGESATENCEDEPQGLPLGISVQKLCKKFSTGCFPGRKKETLAIKNLSINFYEGQITAFLGHNGAGKTTTMSVLTGLFEPSSGTAHIYGNDIRKQMDTIRQSLGMCPQHNILIDQLTVEEHLLLYGQLKGLSRVEAKRQLPIWLNKVGLCEHAHKYAKHLSGGMKRKLSILLAFVGKCKTIILDEPTSGVDPFSKLQIWDFLLNHREGRTIMLSTHHMDEAEILGDRIAIISKGSLLCCGSFEYLKHRFGHGLRLTLVTKAQSERRPSLSSRTFTVAAEVEEQEQDSTDALLPVAIPDEQPLDENVDMEATSFLQSVITGATMIEKRGRELHYRLPSLQARPRVLAKLFSDLDVQKERLGIVSYGMSSCTMEEIFMELTKQEYMENSEPSVSDSSSVVDLQSSVDAPGDVFDDEGLLFGDRSCDDPLGSGMDSRLMSGKLWLIQFYALLVKRLHYTKGNLVALLVQNVFPLLVICLSLLIARFLQTVPNPPPLELSPHLFFAKSHFNYLFAGGYYTNVTSSSIDSLFQPCGVAASTSKHSMCFANSSIKNHCSDYPQQQYICTCPSCDLQSSLLLNDSLFVPYSNKLPQCYNGTISGSRVQNLTVPYNPLDPDISYYSLHNYLLRSTDSFIEQRYGGVSFGHFKETVTAKLDEVNSDPASTLPFLATYSAAKVWYSFKGYHAMPAYLNTMNNAILRGSLRNHSQDQQSQYGIRTVSHPFNLTELEKSIYAVTENISFLVNPLASIFSLGFVLAGFVVLLIEERAGNIKHLQLLCGLNRAVYWLFTYVWDLLWYSAFIVLMIMVYLLFQDPYYTGSDELPLFVLLLLCYGLAATPWMYIWSFLFTSSATAYVFLFCLNFFSGFSFLIIDAIVVQLEDRGGGDLLHYTLVWLPFPAYTLGRSMMYLSLDKPVTASVAAFSATSESISSPYAKLSPFIVSMLVQCIVYSGIVFLIESFPLIMNKCAPKRKLSIPTPANEDEAVAKERRRALRGDLKGDLLVLRNLTKVYGSHCSSQNRLAVNQLCLRMQKAECFGLLGVNGAGKTTTFRMLTGDTPVTSGEASIASHCVAGRGRAIHHSVGYCPQVDALIEPLTGRQHLVFFSRLRGLPAAEVNKVVEWALTKLGLTEHADKPVKAYSGGNRRKLSTAIALLARPALILLDEPTSGVDPHARRFLWTVVRELVSAGQSVLLTTHSMAECEALCSRVGIMVNGSFRCLGSPQQLKSTYGQGYRLKIRAASQVEALKEFIRQNIESANLKEEHCNILVYQLPSVGIQLSAVFNIMESARETLDIEDYSLSQTSLNDVFVHFVNEQREDAGVQVFPSPDSVTSPAPTTPVNSNLPDIVTHVQA